jgi:hypothetical protein
MKNSSGFIAFTVLAVVGLIAWSIHGTIQAAKNLSCRFLKFQIYKFSSSGITFRIRIRFINYENTALHINNINLSAYLNSVTNTDTNGNVVIGTKGDFLASLKDSNLFVIEANAETDKDFYVDVKWEDVGKLLLFNIVDIITYISNNNFQQILSALVGQPVLITGTVTAENIKFPVTEVIGVTQ